MTHTTNLADTLFDAFNQHQPIAKADIPENISKSDAYDVQHQLTEKKHSLNQDKLAGYKISLTSEETQQLFSSTTPLYGALTQTSLVKDGTISLAEMLSPLIEMELMFIANEDVTKADDRQSILQKMSIAPGLEIPDSRFTDWFPKVSLGQIIADSAVAGKIVIGTPVQGLTYEQLENIQATLTLDDAPLAEGPATEVLGNPVRAIEWLMDELAKSGRKIEKGMIVSSGTFILPKPLQKGVYHAQFDHVGAVRLKVI